MPRGAPGVASNYNSGNKPKVTRGPGDGGKITRKRMDRAHVTTGNGVDTGLFLANCKICQQMINDKGGMKQHYSNKHPTVAFDPSNAGSNMWTEMGKPKIEKEEC